MCLAALAVVGVLFALPVKSLSGLLFILQAILVFDVVCGEFVASHQQAMANGMIYIAGVELVHFFVDMQTFAKGMLLLN